MSTEDGVRDPSTSGDAPSASAGAERGRRRPLGRPTSLTVFAAAFTLLVAAAACVAVGNFRPNTTLLPVISFYLSGAAVVLTVIAVVVPWRRPAHREPPEP